MGHCFKIDTRQGIWILASLATLIMGQVKDKIPFHRGQCKSVFESVGHRVSLQSEVLYINVTREWKHCTCLTSSQVLRFDSLSSLSPSFYASFPLFFPLSSPPASPSFLFHFFIFQNCLQVQCNLTSSAPIFWAGNGKVGFSIHFHR
jgi:hypothetical protein